MSVRLLSAREFSFYSTISSRGGYLFVTCLDEQFLSLRMTSSWVTWVRTFVSDESRAHISQVADDEIVSWRERRFHAHEVFSRIERKSDARGHRPVSVEKPFTPNCWRSRID